MTRKLVLIVALLLATATAGCASRAGEPSPSLAEPAGPPPPSGAAEAWAAPEEVGPRLPEPVAYRQVVLDLAGTVLLRAASDPVVLEGHPPEFWLVVPNGTRALAAHAEWSPPQVVGLEFQPPEGDRVRSWKTMPNTQARPPIDLTLPGPIPAGDWWAYLGPSTVGGALTWSLRLTLEVPEGAEAQVEVLACDAGPLLSPAPAPTPPARRCG